MAATPGRKQYEHKYEAYLKERRVPKAKERKWQNYDESVKGRPRTKLPAHLMGFTKPKEPIKKTPLPKKLVKKNKDTILNFKAREKSLFTALRDMYNKLDAGCENSVNTNDFLNELVENTHLKELLSIDDPLELEEGLNEIEVKIEGYLTWEELLQLVFKRVGDNEDTADYLIMETNKKRTPKKTPKKVKDEKKSAQKLPLPKHEFKITVPQPPKFEDRERRKKGEVSIRQRRLIEMLNEEKEEEDMYRNYLIKANPVPVTTTQPLYEQLVEEQQRRSEEIKALSRKITKAREKPFSFYERNKNFHAKRAEAAANYVPEPLREAKPFRANPVPDFVRFEMLPEIQRQEEELRELRKQRAFALAKSAHSPPRMEMHENNRVREEQALDFTFHPAAARPVPDFRTQHETFQHELDTVRRTRTLTVPQPFNLSLSGRRKHVCRAASVSRSADLPGKEKAGREALRQRLEEARMMVERKVIVCSYCRELQKEVRERPHLGRRRKQLENKT